MGVPFMPMGNIARGGYGNVARGGYGGAMGMPAAGRGMVRGRGRGGPVMRGRGAAYALGVKGGAMPQQQHPNSNIDFDIAVLLVLHR